MLSRAVPYAALEAFEADNQSRLYYRVSSLSGEMVSGFAQLPFWRGRIPAKPTYAALVDFYDDVFQEEDVRVYQPFSAGNVRQGSGLGVAISLEIARTLSGSISLDNRVLHGRVTGLDATVRLPLVQEGSK